MSEHVMIPFVLDKTSKVNVRLAGNINFVGEGWRCGLKSFSLDKKWSLMNEIMTVIYTNGYKSVIKANKTHAVNGLRKVLDEMFGKNRPKRSDLFDEITFNDSDDEIEEKETKVKRTVTPPASVQLFDFETNTNTTAIKEPEREVTPPASVHPFPIPINTSETPTKPEIKDDKMKVVSFPTDEPGKSGDKYYIVYKNLRDAILYSPELPVVANHFTEYANNSVNFIYNSAIDRYEANYDNEYVRAIHLSQGFSRALGFNEVVFNGDVAPSSPTKANFYSHLQIFLKDIVCPIYCGAHKDTILDILPISTDSNPISKIYERPNYLRMSINNVDEINIEFRDIYGNPIIGDNATGHILLEFIKPLKKHY